MGWLADECDVLLRTSGSIWYAAGRTRDRALSQELQEEALRLDAAIMRLVKSAEGTAATRISTLDADEEVDE